VVEAQGSLFGDGALGGVTPAVPDGGVGALAGRLPSELRLGTSSWSYPGWEGLVWGSGVKMTETNLSQRGLRAYAAHPLLRAVGVDWSYYAPLSERECRGYAAQVPEDFRFVMKADRVLVMPELPGSRGSVPVRNERMLDASYATDEVIGPAVAGFGSKLGVVVFQFPPLGPLCIERMGGPVGFADRLHDFLSSLPIGPEYAVEVRDPMLLGEVYASALRNSGASHCFGVHPSMPQVSEQAKLIDPGAQRACLVRWMLNPRTGVSYAEAEKRYAPFNRLVDEDERSRRDIVDLMAGADQAARYVLASNNAEGSAPWTLRRLAERMVGGGP
jgi:uncharacterized protein YecE (DUF72 family)